MGYNVYVSKPLMPAVKMLQDAYLAWGLDAEELNDVLKQEIDRRRDGNQVTTKHGDHHKEENENKERTKENKEKEERTHTHQEKFKKESFVQPSFEEVEKYGATINASAEQISKFFHTYDSTGWVTDKGQPIKYWKSRMKLWLSDDNKKQTRNVTNTNQQRQAAGAGAQAAGAAAREEHRKEDLERHLASHHPGDDRLAKLAREIDEVAQEVGVPTTEYTLQQIAYDAQALLYRMVFCEGWTDEKWQQAMAYVKGQMTRKGAKRLGSSTLLELVYEFSKMKS